MEPQPPSEMTLLEALARLEAAGFTGEFRVVVEPGPMVACGKCGARINPAALEIEQVFRLEGESDPSEEVVVAGLHCSGCGMDGVLVATYGPMADPADADVVLALTDHRPR